MSSQCKNATGRTPRRTLRKDPTVKGVANASLTEIYRAKCLDMNIPAGPDQSYRFFSLCARNLTRRRVNLSDNGLGLNSAEALGNLLRNNKHFAYVNLANNVLGDAGVLAFARLIRKNLQIVSIDITNNGVSPEGLAQFLNAIREHLSLTGVYLGSCERLHMNRLGPQGAQVLSNYLKMNTLLSIVEVPGTSIGLEGLGCVGEALRNSSLYSLNIAHNHLGPGSLESFFKEVARSQLRDLNIAGNTLGNDNCEHLSNLIQLKYGNCCLEKLNLAYNEIGAKGVAKLFMALKNNTTLAFVNLEGNPIKNLPSEALQELLVRIAQLKSLNLAKCKLGDEGLACFAEGLARNHSLFTLNLSSNALTDSAIENIVAGLKHNNTLRTLDLSSNMIKTRGGIMLAHCLRENKFLEYLYLKDNSLRDQAATMFRETIRINKGVISLCLDSNRISSDLIKQIKAILVANRTRTRKEQIPKLKAKVESLQTKDSVLSDMYKNINMKEEEKQEFESLNTRQVDKLIHIRHREKEMLNEFRRKFETLKECQLELATTLSKLESDLQREAQIGIQTVINLDRDIERLINDIRKLERTSNHYIGSLLNEQNAQKEGSRTGLMERSKKTLKIEEIAYGSALKLLERLKDERKLIHIEKSKRKESGIH